MDPISVSASVVGVLSTAATIFQGVFAQSLPGHRYRLARFGWFGECLYFFHLVDTDALQELHWNINIWTDDEIFAWKASHMASCNAISVAGAIFASVGLSALQLPGINDVNWSARALCGSSMVLGILSVMMATIRQSNMATLNSAVAIRLWLSRGAPQDYFPPKLVPYQTRRQHDTKYRSLRPFSNLPLESSVSALKLIEFPRWLLTFAVVLFITGFGLYWLFLWIEKVPGDSGPNRNAFIVFAVTVGVFLIYYGGLVGARIESGNRKAAEFNLGSLNSWKSDSAIRDLERDLDQCQQRLNLARKWHEEARSREATNTKTGQRTSETGNGPVLVQPDDDPHTKGIGNGVENDLP